VQAGSITYLMKHPDFVRLPRTEAPPVAEVNTNPEQELVVVTTLTITTTLPTTQLDEWGFTSVREALDFETNRDEGEVYQHIIESIEMGPSERRTLKYGHVAHVRPVPPVEDPLPGM
jgi:hypothetical protein